MVVADTGVEGVMRSCCEKTLGVLRENKESLITIIEVAASCMPTNRLMCASVLTMMPSQHLYAASWPCCFMLLSAVSPQGKHQTRVSIVA